MLYKNRNIIFSLLLFLVLISANCQSVVNEQKIDSLSKLSYAELNVNFRVTGFDSIIALNHAKAYLFKAKKEKKKIRISDGYYFLSGLTKGETSISYCDSILKLTSDLKNNLKYPTIAYKQKGGIYHDLGNFDKALEFYLLALNHAKNNELEYFTIKFNIAFLKYTLGYREEALELFKEYLDFTNTIKVSNKSFYNNRALYAVSDALIYTKKLDSAENTIKLGIYNTLKSNDSITYSRFVLNSGICSFYKKKYKQAIDSLLKSRAYIFNLNDKLTLSINDSYLGKSYYYLGNKKKGIDYLKKADLLVKKTNDITPEILDNYGVLIKYYKEKKDHKNQIFYINSLLKIDSVFNKKYKKISTKIANQYDIPQLISSKQALIKKINKEKISFRNTALFFLAATLFLIFISIFYINRSIKMKKRFNDLLKSKNFIDKGKKENIKSSTKIDLPDPLIDEILRKLEIFEKSNKYINEKYNLNSLAKEFNTNSRYLSHIINNTKNTNFSNYLNNLKIDYAINKLRSEYVFRSYTIKAIAIECGFNNAESFASAFYKKTKLYPSYFLKQLNVNHKKTI